MSCQRRALTWLDDGIGLLETVASLIVPEVDGSVIATRHHHAIFVYSQRIDWGVLSRHVLQEP